MSKPTYDLQHYEGCQWATVGERLREDQEPIILLAQSVWAHWAGTGRNRSSEWRMLGPGVTVRVIVEAKL